MLFELRMYRLRPGKREAWVTFMEERIIPFQVSKGMVIVASFLSEEEEDLYVWIRRFDSEEDRVRLYAAVYESEEWQRDFKDPIGELIDRQQIKVLRLNPTPKSVIR